MPVFTFAQVSRVMPHKITVALVVALAALLAAVSADPSVGRRSGMGFVGMRGKKDVPGGGAVDEPAAAVDVDKRTLVFRRPLYDGGRTVDGGADDGGPADGYKRAMGFVGMRGKKEYYRGPASAAGFFGMRGKKVPSADAFFGMRGKKWPELAVPPQQLDREADDADVERAVLVLHRIIDRLRSERGERRSNRFGGRPYRFVPFRRGDSESFRPFGHIAFGET